MKHEESLLHIREQLEDAMSLIILLENDLSIHQSDDLYSRIMKMIHNIIKNARKELVEINEE